ncbi:MAG: hypothetical protein E7211_20535 [Clostridium lundense]|nr:hypothetical protein [Clostridium lundense]
MISQARVLARMAIERLYEDKCTVTEVQKTKDPVTHITSSQPVLVLENQPCKLSFSSIKSADESSNVASVEQVVKLFISPDITIKPGSKITVTHLEKVIEYSCSGQEVNYPTHKEIVLQLFKEYA